jgi:20S proteasome alpha/beta subunit
MLRALAVLLTSLLLAEPSYDHSSLQFTPQGRVRQLEYAQTAARRGSPLVGWVCNDGIVVMANAGGLNACLVPGGCRVFVTGLRADACFILEQCKKFALHHETMFSETITCEALSHEVAELLHQHTRAAGCRPLGVDVLITGLDLNRIPRLLVCNTDGVRTGFKAVACGTGYNIATDFLMSAAKQWSNQSVDDVVSDAVPTVRQLFRKFWRIPWNQDRHLWGSLEKDNECQLQVVFHFEIAH